MRTTPSREFPNTKFAIIDYHVGGRSKDKPKNVRWPHLKSASESGYLVGYLAGLMAKKQGGKQVIGAVGGKKIPPVDIWIAGYRAGATKANKNIKVLIDYSERLRLRDRRSARSSPRTRSARVRRRSSRSPVAVVSAR